MAKHTREELRQWQALPLAIKVRMTQQRIRDWVREYGENGVYIAFSGGKDSTVLSHIVDATFPGNNIPRVFVDTGLEYPEIREFVKQDPRAIFLKPQMNFKKIIEKYGYPFISKEVSECVYFAKKSKESGGKKYKEFFEKITGCGPFGEGAPREQFSIKAYNFFLEQGAPELSHVCCRIMKKTPTHGFSSKTGRAAMTAEMAQESRRRSVWLIHGCNMYDAKNPKSTPMAFWTEQDVLAYIKQNAVKICSVYGDIVIKSDTIPEGQTTIFDCGIAEEETQALTTTGCKRTGCMYCGYGCHLEKPGEGRFERMKKTHPKQYEWIMKPKEEGGLDYKRVIDWINEHGNTNIRY